MPTDRQDRVSELSKKISFKVMPEGSKMVVSTDTLDTIGEIFTIIDDEAMESSLNVIVAHIERDEEFLTGNKEMNLIIASAGIMGARTLTLVIFNEQMGEFVPPTPTESNVFGPPSFMPPSRRGPLEPGCDPQRQQRQPHRDAGAHEITRT